DALPIYSLEAYRWLVDWTQRYGTLSTLQSQGYNRWSPGKFLEQRQAMMVAHNEMVTVATEIHGIEVGAGPLPSPSGRDNGTWSGGFALAIPAGAKNLEGEIGRASGRESMDIGVVDQSTKDQ